MRSALDQALISAAHAKDSVGVIDALEVMSEINVGGDWVVALVNLVSSLSDSTRLFVMSHVVVRDNPEGGGLVSFRRPGGAS